MTAIRVISIFALGLFLASCATKAPPRKTGLELQALQSRDFENPKRTVFPSVLTVLQDAGYIIMSADLDTGFITGNSPTESSTGWDIFVGMTSNQNQTRVTATITPKGQGISHVRVNFVEVKQTSGLYGQGSREDTPLENPALYENVFEKISEAIFIMTATE